MTQEVIGFEPRPAWWKSRLIITTPKGILYYTDFLIIFILQQRDKKNMAPPEKLEIKH